MARFCFDSNVLIEAKNGPYAFDITPGFWSWLDSLIARGDLYCPTFVYEELVDREDDLSYWVKERKDTGMVMEAGESVQLAFKHVAAFVSERYSQAHAQAFLAAADPWVIAHGIADSSVIVTQEQLVDRSSRKVKIPNVCRRFEVEYTNTFAMLRQTGMSLR
jgi:hypothetical protein